MPGLHQLKNDNENSTNLWFLQSNEMLPKTESLRKYPYCEGRASCPNPDPAWSRPSSGRVTPQSPAASCRQSSRARRSWSPSPVAEWSWINASWRSWFRDAVKHVPDSSQKNPSKKQKWRNQWTVFDDKSKFPEEGPTPSLPQWPISRGNSRGVMNYKSRQMTPLCSQ